MEIIFEIQEGLADWMVSFTVSSTCFLAGSEQLPPSMVSLGWELPFPSNLREPFAPGVTTDPLSTDIWPPPQGLGNPATLPQVMAAFSAAAWNIIGEEQPPRVRLRLWR